MLKAIETESRGEYLGSKRIGKGKWRRFRYEELYSLYRSLNIVRVIKSRKLRCARQVSKMKKVGLFSKF